MVRLSIELKPSDHRVLIPAAALVGGLVALTTDLVTHLPWAKHFRHLVFSGDDCFSVRGADLTVAD